jgi:hypothetical protein
MSSKLMKNFPLEDQGMVLIYGPLPSNASLKATTYPANDIFDMKHFQSFKIIDQTGFGLVFGVKENQVSVQHGNAAFVLERHAVVSSQYSVYSTGLPTPVSEVTTSSLANASEISGDSNKGESTWFGFEPALFSSMTQMVCSQARAWFAAARLLRIPKIRKSQLMRWPRIDALPPPPNHFVSQLPGT